MMEAVEFTFNQLNVRTKNMFETLERVNKKHNKTHSDFQNVIDVIREMREEAQALLKRQEKIAKSFKQSEQGMTLGSGGAYTSSGGSGVGGYTPQPVIQRKAKKYDSDDEADYEPVKKTKAAVDERTLSEVESDEEWEQKKADKKKRDHEAKKEEPTAVNDNRTQSEIESDEEWERKRQEKKQQQDAELAADDVADVEAEKPTIIVEEAKKEAQTQSEIESDEEFERQQKERKQKQEAELAALDADAEADDKPAEAPTPKTVDDRTQSEIESDEEFEQKQAEKKKQVEEERAKEFEEEEERIRLEALKLASETAHDDEDYDEEQARQAAAQAIAGLKDDE